MANVAKYLTHKGQYFPATLDRFTDVTSPTSSSTVECFAYFGEASRHAGGFGGHQFNKSEGWFVILPTRCHSVQVGDRLDNIVDNNGVLVKSEGRIEQLVVYRHHRKGIQFVQARLNDN